MTFNAPKTLIRFYYVPLESCEPPWPYRSRLLQIVGSTPQSAGPSTKRAERPDPVRANNDD